MSICVKVSKVYKEIMGVDSRLHSGDMYPRLGLSKLVNRNLHSQL